MHTPDEQETDDEILAITAPQWATAFVMLAAMLSTVPFLIGFLFGASVSSDLVFGFYALISGVAADRILVKKFNRRLLFWRRPRITFVLFWIALCGYVMLFQPLQ